MFETCPTDSPKYSEQECFEAQYELATGIFDLGTAMLTYVAGMYLQNHIGQFSTIAQQMLSFLFVEAARNGAETTSSETHGAQTAADYIDTNPLFGLPSDTIIRDND